MKTSLLVVCLSLAVWSTGYAAAEDGALNMGLPSCHAPTPGSGPAALTPG